MTLPEASAAIDVHNGTPIGAGRVQAQAKAVRTAKQDRFLYDVCDRLRVAPVALARIPFERVLAVVLDMMKGKPIVEATVKAEVARFAADHAEPEASPLKPTNPAR